ncbi:hypothetical protein EX30DRAFT_342097 [Ascodesmis nigricans]|uniref:Uncharacterized protein n=1 Tax=Ascodesmis nigricans TaxID=341454 RepID=A0A4S2MTF2_9PEZI|nr:hypothetical protein EX30DRAFT_342097 [Ascodesmis nigricans]
MRIALHHPARRHHLLLSPPSILPVLSLQASRHFLTLSTPRSSSTTPFITSSTSTSHLARQLPHQQSCSMSSSSDDAYAAFLSRANRDYSAPQGQQQAPTLSTAEIGEEHTPHPAIRALGERYYVSDADEPFVGVELSAEGLIGGAEFAKLLKVEEDTVEVLKPQDWDVRSEYKDVVDAVRESCGGAEVRVYRVQEAGSRALYYVLGFERGRLRGVRVKAVES